MYKKSNPNPNKINKLLGVPESMKPKYIVMFDFPSLLKMKPKLYGKIKLPYALDNLKKYGLVKEVYPREIIKEAKKINPKLKKIHKELKKSMNEYYQILNQNRIEQSRAEKLIFNSSDLFFSKAKRTFVLTENGIWFARILKREPK